MEFNDDGLKGLAVGAVAVLFVWIVFGLNSCSETYTIGKPDTRETCVVHMGIIQDCYPAEKIPQ